MSSRFLKAAILLAFALLVCIRMPEIVWEGRFWAEEGAHFYSEAWRDPPVRAILMPFGGYLNLVASSSTVLARWTLPVADAPYLTIGTALVFQLLPPLVILTASDPWLRPWRVRVVAILLILFDINSDEVWLQTLHCQFELTLTAALILGLDMPSLRSAFAWRLVPLGLAPLCGPGAFALVPLFFLRALSERSVRRLAEGSVIAAATLIQVACFFSRSANRANALHPVLYLCTLTVRHLAAPLLGMAHADVVADGIRAELASGHVPVLATALPVLVFGVVGAVAARAGRHQPALWLFAAAASVSLLSSYGAISSGTEMISAYLGERYFFVPQAMLSLGILALGATTAERLSGVFRFIALWFLVIGASGYFFPWPLIAHGPNWRTEVAAWRRDPAKPLHLWPTWWVMELSPSHS